MMSCLVQDLLFCTYNLKTLGVDTDFFNKEKKSPFSKISGYV